MTANRQCKNPACDGRREQGGIACRPCWRELTPWTQEFVRDAYAYWRSDAPDAQRWWGIALRLCERVWADELAPYEARLVHTPVEPTSEDPRLNSPEDVGFV